MTRSLSSSSDLSAERDKWQARAEAAEQVVDEMHVLVDRYRNVLEYEHDHTLDDGTKWRVRKALDG